jgi:hypothetical protein
LSDSKHPRDFAGAYASDEHLARLLVRDLWGAWVYSVITGRWYRRLGDQWVAALPHDVRARCMQTVEAVIRDAEQIPAELRTRPGLVERVLDLATFDMRILCGSDPSGSIDGPAK